jgi:hypothetical protein
MSSSNLDSVMLPKEFGGTAVKANSKHTINSSNSPSRKVTGFSDLPTEIRLHIWGWLSQGNRIVSFTLAEMENNNSPEISKLLLSAPVPSVLQINRESRKISLKYYTLVFAEQLNGKPLYFNFDRDWLHWETRHAWNILTLFGQKKLSEEEEDKFRFTAIGPRPEDSNGEVYKR